MERPGTDPLINLFRIKTALTFNYILLHLYLWPFAINRTALKTKLVAFSDDKFSFKTFLGALRMRQSTKEYE